MRKREVKVYQYLMADGSPHYETVRYEPKDFRQRRHDSSGKPIWNLDGVERIPYNLPALNEAIRSGGTIIVVEGEKDADSLNELGFVATTSCGGAAWAWTQEFCAYFGGAAEVVVVADNDEAGREAARDRARQLRVVVDRVALIEQLPEVPEKGDASVLVDMGWGFDRLCALFESALRETDAVNLVDDLMQLIRRFVVLDDDACLATALWVIHTHAFGAADATPYLSIGSPQPRCGKSRLLEILDLVVAKPWMVSGTSSAALIRKVNGSAPTLLLDEVDALLGGGDKEQKETLRGILDAGHRRGGVATRCVGPQFEPTDFSVFCPKALAGIGGLPGTVADRSIRIELQRRGPGERIERFRRKKVEPVAADLRSRVSQWALANVDKLRAAEPRLPEGLSDRATDGWEPLFAIADLHGCGDRARSAAANLAGVDATEVEDASLRTLRDIRGIFSSAQVDRMSSQRLVNALRAIDDGPYQPFRGREFEAAMLARRLRRYGIRPLQFRDDDKPVRGYAADQFSEAWSRYCGPQELAG